MASTTTVPRVLVTGATGFIATHIIKQLQEAGYRVRGTVRSLKNEAKVRPLRELCPEANHPLELVEAELTDETPWCAAVKDCTYVLHTASPFVLANPKDEEEILKPAREGTLFVLRACAQARCVKRVVLTSSWYAVHGIFSQDSPQTCTEENWADLSQTPDASTYFKSKVVAERVAWDYLKELPDGQKFELAVINPVFVMGPVMCGGTPTSMQFMMALMSNSSPASVNEDLGYCDVRDVAKAHLQAMIVPGAAGNRHLIFSGNLWMKEVQEILAKEFNPQGFGVKLDKTENKEKKGRNIISNTRMRKVLGIEPIPPRKTIVDMVSSLIARGDIKKN